MYEKHSDYKSETAGLSIFPKILILIAIVCILLFFVDIVHSLDFSVTESDSGITVSGRFFPTVPESVYLYITGYATMLYTPDTFEVDSTDLYRQRRLFNFIYIDSNLVAVERIGYCEPVSSRRFMALCPNKSKYYADTSVYDSLKAVEENGGRLW